MKGDYMPRNIKQRSAGNNAVDGSIVISKEVIEVISGIVIEEIDGVYGMQGGFSSEVSKLFNQPTHRKGIQAEEKDGEISIEVECLLKQGYSVPEIAREIQEKVKTQVKRMTDIEVGSVQVHIVDIVYDQEIEAFNSDGASN